MSTFSSAIKAIILGLLLLMLPKPFPQKPLAPDNVTVIHKVVNHD